MVTYIRYRILKNNLAAFNAAMTRGMALLSNFKPCRSYELSQCISEPENFILRIEWSADGDVINMDKGSKNFQDFMEKTEAFRDNILEMRNYRPMTLEK